MGEQKQKLIFTLIKGGVMRKILGLSMLLTLLAVPAAVTPVYAGASVGLSLEVRSGYSTCDDFDADMDWDNLIVINNDRIGFWIMLPSGMQVFHCRDMYYDYGCDEWRYLSRSVAQVWRS